MIAAPLHAAARLEVSGETRQLDQALEVRVGLANRGDAAMRGVVVAGELLGHHDEARLSQPIEAGQTGQALLHFPLAPPRPGTYALTMLVEYQEAGKALSQPAFLLLALGENPPPDVDVVVVPLRVMDMGKLIVRLSSKDGAPHKVRLRGIAPKGLRLRDPAGPVDLAAMGSTEVGLTVFRGVAPRATAQGVLIVAETEDGPLARSSVTAGTIEVLPDPAWLPRLRVPLLVLAIALLLAAVWAEWRCRPGGLPEPVDKPLDRQ